MHANDLVTDEGRDGEAIEDIAEGLPKIDAVASLAIVAATIDPAYGWRLMDLSEHEETMGVLDLVREEKADRLEAALAAVHIVAEEGVIDQRRIAAMLEDLQQVVILAVHVAEELHKRLDV